MKRYIRLLVPLGLRDLDCGAISWASRISRLADSEYVFFIHTLDAPNFPEKMESLVNEVWEKMQFLLGYLAAMQNPYWSTHQSRSSQRKQKELGQAFYNLSYTADYHQFSACL